MVTANRPELARRAVECFRAQTYEAKRLFVFDNSEARPYALIDNAYAVYEPCAGRSIAELRNHANAMANASILVHWDDDDWSHPNRIAEQVALLQSGAELVGYNEMLFWRSSMVTGPPYPAVCPSCILAPCICSRQAWLYTGEILGTSMAYWRRTWERVPFQSGGHHNEDAGFALGVRAAGMRIDTISGWPYRGEPEFIPHHPRMIARIHAGNAKNQSYDPAQMAAHPHHWQRVPAWDKYCEGVMER